VSVVAEDYSVSDDTTEAIREAASAGPLVPFPLHDVHPGAVVTTCTGIIFSVVDPDPHGSSSK
jgi:hypothetical protein